MKSSSNFYNQSKKNYNNSNESSIDIDAICSELYDCSSLNRNKFNEIITKLNNDVLNSNHYLLSDQYSKLFDDNNNVKHYHHQSQEYIQKSNEAYIFPKQLKFQIPRFIPTIPLGEMVNLLPICNIKKHHKYSDFNANSSYYYPEIYTNSNKKTIDTPWTNRTNSLIIHSQHHISNSASKTFKSQVHK